MPNKATASGIVHVVPRWSRTRRRDPLPTDRKRGVPLLAEAPPPEVVPCEGEVFVHHQKQEQEERVGPVEARLQHRRLRVGRIEPYRDGGARRMLGHIAAGPGAGRGERMALDRGCRCRSGPGPCSGRRSSPGRPCRRPSRCGSPPRWRALRPGRRRRSARAAWPQAPREIVVQVQVAMTTVGRPMKSDPKRKTPSPSGALVDMRIPERSRGRCPGRCVTSFDYESYGRRAEP